MSDDNEFAGEGNDTQQTESGSALRKFANDQKKLAEQYMQELKEIRAKLAKTEAEQIFSKLGVPEKVRKFYTGDPTEDAISEWVKENADVFGIELGEGSEDITSTSEQRENADALSRVQDASSLGRDRQTAMSRQAMQETRQNLLSQKNSTVADLEAALAKLNVPNAPLMAPQF